MKLHFANNKLFEAIKKESIDKKESIHKIVIEVLKKHYQIKDNSDLKEEGK